MKLTEINVLKPTDSLLDNDNYLVKMAIDYVNSAILTKDYKIENGEMKIEIGGEKFKMKSVIDTTCNLFNENGWVARHSDCYSSKFACPTHAIFIKPKP